MSEKGPYKELPIDEQRVTAAFNHVVNFAKGYLHEFSVAEAIQISLERNVAGQGFLNDAEQFVLIAKLKEYIARS